jgi:DNA primase
MRFPQTFIDDLKRQADIVRIVQDYVSLKKTGANWVAPCPFHKETKPSFSVNPAKEMFFCFGCHKGGTVFTFVMEIERVDFPEAIRIVAEKSGMPLPKMVDDGRFEARKRDSDQVIELNQWALQWWQDQLKSKTAGSVREYLKQRGITDETSETFHLGFAPDSWEALSTHLRQKGATQEQLEKSGLVVKKDEGGSYDRFRGRLMFPVFDAQGKPIAFGGRVLDPEGEPKYLNSPETSAYVKGRHLYGLHLTRDEIRRAEFAILVEGYLDLIVPYQFGVRNVVASLGTALTPEQVKLVGRFARKVVVNYDGDRAGVQAAKRAIETILAEDIEVKILVLPDNSDPDEFIRKNGVSEYQRLRGKAKPFIDFLAKQAGEDYDFANPQQKEQAVEEVMQSLGFVASSLQLREYYQIAMNELYVPESERHRYWHRLRHLYQERVRLGRPLRDKTYDRYVPPKPTDLAPMAAERDLVKLLLSDKTLRRPTLLELSEPAYQWLPSSVLFGAMYRLEQHGDWEISDLQNEIREDPFANKLLVEMISEAKSWDEIVPESIQSCITAIKKASIDRRISALASDALIAERAENYEERDRLSLEQVNLIRFRNQL